MSHVKGPYHPERCKKLWPYREDIMRMSLAGVPMREIAVKFGTSYTTVGRFVNRMGWRTIKSPRERYAEHRHITYNGVTYSYRKNQWARSGGNRRSLARDMWEHTHPGDVLSSNDVIMVVSGDFSDLSSIKLKKVSKAELCRNTFYPEDDEFTSMFHRAMALGGISLLHEKHRTPEGRAIKSAAMRKMWSERHDELEAKVKAARALKVASDPDYYVHRAQKARETRKKRLSENPNYYMDIARKRKATIAERRMDG